MLKEGIGTEIEAEDQEKPAGFNYRIVEYEKIHKTTDEQFKQLIDSVDPQPGQVILDGMDGYGSVAKLILKRGEENGFKPEVYALDVSPVQNERAKENIPGIDEDHVVEADIRETKFPPEMFDSVVIKMGCMKCPKMNNQRYLLRYSEY